MGTQVTYDGECEGSRSGFSWIVGGHKNIRKVTRIIVTVPGAISFQIIVPVHDIKSSVYIERVKRFNQGTATAEDLLDTLGLSRPLTRPGTGAHTPKTGEMTLKEKIGEGSFGVVTHLVNITTGDERVIKTPSKMAIREGQVDHKAWKLEAEIMGLINHVCTPILFVPPYFNDPTVKYSETHRCVLYAAA